MRSAHQRSRIRAWVRITGVLLGMAACDGSVSLDCSPLSENDCRADPEHCAFGEGIEGLQCYTLCDPEGEEVCGEGLACEEAFVVLVLEPGTPTEPGTAAIWHCLPPGTGLP
jgi:hypothetical protein